ncbi:hypothetical protein C0995_007749, partial [Termitomyces sp. Mi166
MVADYVSANFGWLCSKDGKRLARCIIKPEKDCDGYFSSDDIVEQANEAMEIMTDDYS